MLRKRFSEKSEVISVKGFFNPIIQEFAKQKCAFGSSQSCHLCYSICPDFWTILPGRQRLTRYHPGRPSFTHQPQACQDLCTMSPMTWLSERPVRLIPRIPKTTNTMAPVSTSGRTAGFPQPVFMQGLNPEVADSFALGAAIKYRRKNGYIKEGNNPADSLAQSAARCG